MLRLLGLAGVAVLGPGACYRDTAAPPGPRSPPPVSPAMPTQCTVRGHEVQLDSVRVRAEDGTAFRVGISGVPVDATLGERGQVQLAVHGAIAFSATLDRVPVHVSAGAAIERGQLRLAPGATVMADGFARGRLVGDAVLYSEHASVDADGQRTPAESIATRDVACDGVTLDYVRNDDSSIGRLGDGTWWQTRGDSKQLVLRAEPHDGAPAITYANPYCGNGPCFALVRTATRGAWTQLAKSNEHVAVQGWVRTAELDRVPDGVAAGGYSYCTCDADGYSYFGELGAPPERDARIALGTQLFVAPGTGPWATVTGDAVFGVRYRPGDTWAEIVRIPGIARARWDAAGRPPAFIPIAALRP